jgi:hypothetical protein
MISNCKIHHIVVTQKNDASCHVKRPLCRILKRKSGKRLRQFLNKVFADF